MKDQPTVAKAMVDRFKRTIDPYDYLIFKDQPTVAKAMVGKWAE